MPLIKKRKNKIKEEKKSLRQEKKGRGIESFDLVVIGTGMAGMSAALFAAGRGLSTALVGESDQLLFSGGFLDLLGVHPVADQRVWEDPWEGIKTLAQDEPAHPLARVKPGTIRDAFDELLGFLRENGLFYDTRKDQNTFLPTCAGTIKISYALPRTMHAGVTAFEEKSPCLVVDFERMKGFSARQMASVLKESWPGLRAESLSISDIVPRGEVLPLLLAQALESRDVRQKLAQAVLPLLKGAQAVGLPAVLGLPNADRVVAGLEEEIGIPVFEAPSMPPGAPGARLKNAFERGLPARGVTPFFHTRVNGVHQDGVCFTLEIGEKRLARTLSAKGIILATGRFLGKGLAADRTHVRETLFDLPVSQPDGRAQWHRVDFFDTRGHAVNRAGVEVDDFFRPLGNDGAPVFDKLFACGSILAHQDWVRAKCGSGLAIATARAAVEACNKSIG